MPVFHGDALRQFPQHCALALTNCFYLSHRCVTLGFEFRRRLPRPVRPEAASFADQVLKLRLAGIEIFQEQLRRQRDGLRDILNESGFSKLQGEAQLPPQMEKSLKQILHQAMMTQLSRISLNIVFL